MKSCMLIIGLLLSIHSVNSQNVGIGTNSPVARLHVTDSSVLFSGTYSLPPVPNPPPVSGGGKRMMWYADKAAFRVGAAFSSQWDQAYIGNYSFAAGESPVASGNNSIALGSVSATGDYSVAMGYGGSASSVLSVSLGFNSSAVGDYSTAIGGGRSVGEASIALAGAAFGRYSLAAGNTTIATGYSSFVAGMYNDTLVARQMAVSATTPLFIIGNGDGSQSRSNALVVQKNGKVLIGDPGVANLGTKLQVTGAINNVTLADNSGLMSIGYYTSTNMVIDQNDIQVRQSGAAADLNLQRLGGNLMIGSGTADQKLSVNGNASKPGGGSWATFSDSRLKQNITPYRDGLTSLLQINPVWFNYNEASGYDTQQEYVGILAQELQKISPYMISQSSVKTAPDGAGYLQVDNSAMTYMLINAVKEQQQQIEALKKLNTQLINRLEILETKK